MTCREYIDDRYDPSYLIEEIADYFNDSNYPTQYINCKNGKEQRLVIGLIARLIAGSGYNFILGFDPCDFSNRDWKYIYHDNLSREIHVTSRAYGDGSIIDLESLIDNACMRELDAKKYEVKNTEVSVLNIDDLFSALSA